MDPPVKPEDDEERAEDDEVSVVLRLSPTP
jgi:hypothetical protein